jgi:hypothetical protein
MLKNKSEVVEDILAGDTKYVFLDLQKSKVLTDDKITDNKITTKEKVRGRDTSYHADV